MEGAAEYSAGARPRIAARGHTDRECPISDCVGEFLHEIPGHNRRGDLQHCLLCFIYVLGAPSCEAARGKAREPGSIPGLWKRTARDEDARSTSGQYLGGGSRSEDPLLFARSFAKNRYEEPGCRSNDRPLVSS